MSQILRSNFNQYTALCKGVSRQELGREKIETCFERAKNISEIHCVVSTVTAVVICFSIPAEPLPHWSNLNHQIQQSHQFPPRQCGRKILTTIQRALSRKSIQHRRVRIVSITILGRIIATYTASQFHSAKMLPIRAKSTHSIASNTTVIDQHNFAPCVEMRESCLDWL